MSPWPLPPELEELARTLDPGVYVANVRVEGVPEYDLLSDALRDALGGSTATSYSRLIDAYLREYEGEPLVFQASDEFSVNRPLQRALRQLSRRVVVIILNRGRLSGVEYEDLTPELIDLGLARRPEARVDAVYQPGETLTLVSDARDLLRGLAVAGITLLIVRTTVEGAADFWTLTALGLAGLALSKLG